MSIRIINRVSLKIANALEAIGAALIRKSATVRLRTYESIADHSSRAASLLELSADSLESKAAAARTEVQAQRLMAEHYDTLAANMIIVDARGQQVYRVDAGDLQRDLFKSDKQ